MVRNLSLFFSLTGSRTDVSVKNIDIDVAFIKTRMNNEWNVNFLQSGFFGIQNIYFQKLPYFWYDGLNNFNGISTI